MTQSEHDPRHVAERRTRALAGSALGAMALVWATNAGAQEADSSAQEQAAPAQRLDQAGTAGGPKLTFTDARGHSVHVLPTVPMSAAVRAAAAASGALLYHSGGPIMQKIEIYNIFWVPPTLQNGTAASLPSYYAGVMNNLGKDYAGHTVSSNNTQYYQIIGSKTFVSGLSLLANANESFGGSFTDTSAYPPSDCTDSVTPGNCIIDTDIQKEVQKVITAQGWKTGLNEIFNVYTAVGEGSCFDSTSGSCSYTQYCAYHGSIGSGSSSIVYSNEPYAAATGCQASVFPNHADSDSAASVTSHEITESITDPNLDAWYTSGGSEIGDLCAWNYGTNAYDSGKANQQWNGRFYEIQMMYDNHTASCVQDGP
ncbi:MAG TPA: hypothetical protein VFE63_00905 [Roseiarcus sp.]|nr:hypothetical protein [Roseiarcus sp.]